VIDADPLRARLTSTRDLTNPSRDGKHCVRMILTLYVKDMINDGDYERLEQELLDIIRAERRLVLRVTRRGNV